MSTALAAGAGAEAACNLGLWAGPRTRSASTPRTLLVPSRGSRCDACSAAGAFTGAACCSPPRGRVSSASVLARAVTGYMRLLTGSCWAAPTSWSAWPAGSSRGSRPNRRRPGPADADQAERVAGGRRDERGQDSSIGRLTALLEMPSFCGAGLAHLAEFEQVALLAIQGHRRPAPPPDKGNRIGGNIQAATSPDHHDPQPDC
jgi:hypothetical protein